MRTPTYEVVRIGDRYVTILKDPYPNITKAAYYGGGALLSYMGMKRRGLAADAVLIAGAGLLLRGVLGRNPLNMIFELFADHDRDPQRGHSVSYQNDMHGRARQAPSDIVDEQSMESFPASDAPARTGVSLAR